MNLILGFRLNLLFVFSIFRFVQYNPEVHICCRYVIHAINIWMLYKKSFSEREKCDKEFSNEMVEEFVYNLLH